MVEFAKALIGSTPLCSDVEQQAAASLNAGGQSVPALKMHPAFAFIA